MSQCTLYILNNFVMLIILISFHDTHYFDVVVPVTPESCSSNDGSVKEQAFSNVEVI